MAGAAVRFLLENLKQLLVDDNAGLDSDLKQQVELLCDDLGLFKVFLQDSAGKLSEHEVLKELVKQIRDTVYEAEDVIDTFIADQAAAVHKGRSPMQKAFNILDYTDKLRKVAEEIKSIRTRISGIYENERFGFEELRIGDEYEGSPEEKQAPIVEEDNVVEVEDEVKRAVDLLKGGSDELEAILIVGVAGFGPTRLAKMIYHHPIIEYKFYSRTWVHVSQDYNRKQVFLNILGDLKRRTEDIYEMNEENLAKKIYKILEEKKYLVVMDGVWTEQAWNDLKIVFPKNNTKSRILITNPIKKVVQHANRNTDPHDLRFLKYDVSWKLLKLETLGSENCPEEEDGKRIAARRRRPPLAIVVIGGVLLEKDTDLWARVANSMEAYVVMDQYKHVGSLIELVYNHLTYHLKTCFIYLSMFPVYFEIPVWELVRLWIAEGFVQPKDGMSLEDIGEEYLNDLVNRNLVMVGARRSNGKLKTCRVHEMVHDFCKRVAAQENFCQEVKGFDQGANAFSNYTLHMCRRLCVHDRVLNFISSEPVGLPVRSFVCFSNNEIDVSDKHVSFIPRAFKLLSVLHARSICFSRFPSGMVKLVHLRYIVFSCDLKILPTTMSSLRNIQTLVLETSSRKLDIKADIWKMIQLRHVKITASTTLPSPLSNNGKGKDEVLMLECLQTLSNVSPESCTEDVFSRVPNLKNLGIRGLLAKLFESKGGSTPFDGLGKLSHLENLKLLNDRFPRPTPQGKLDGLPEWYRFPPKLKKLTLSDTFLDWKNMSTLGMLENLEILKLKNHAFVGDQWRSKDGGFRALQVLLIGRTDLITWDATACHFPRLRRLYLDHCENLSALPLALADISSLQLVDICRISEAAVSTARRVREEILEKRKQMQGDQSARGGGFKLSIYPPDL